jgi:hypothetical protein
MQSGRHFVGCSLLCFLLAACGGGKPAEAPETSTEEAAPAAEESGADEGASAEETSEPSEEPKPAPKAEATPPDTGSSGPTPPRTPKDIVTSADVIFMFSFNDSDPKKQAEEKCEASSKGNAKKNADCMASARKKFDHDGYRFKQDASGKWQWQTIKRNGNKLVTLHKVPIEFGTETKNSITLKVTGKDTGTAPSKQPAEVTFEVPNDYQIVRKDPKLGALVYEAKIGITGE